MELVLDEDEPVKYVFGLGTVDVPFEVAKDRVAGELKEKKGELERFRAQKAELEVRIATLKRALSGKFGDAIRLD